MRILHASTYAVQPWKNGGGMTTEIIASPPGASFDAIDWRISMARVERAGPFSMFAGIDRSLGVLEGEGLLLAVDGRGVVALKPGMHPLTFPGDVPVEARLIGGPVLDLGVMTRRGRWRHHLSRVEVTGAFDSMRQGDITITVVRGTSGTADGQRFEDGDTIVIGETSRDTTVRLDFSTQCVLWIADLWRVS